MKPVLIVLVTTAANILWWLLIAHIILSWIKTMNPTLWKISEAVGQLVDPILRPFRKVIPALDLGGIAIDLTVIVVLFLLRIVERVLVQLILALPI